MRIISQMRCKMHSIALLLLAAAACSDADDKPSAYSANCASLMPAEYVGIIFTRSSGSSTFSVNDTCFAFVDGSEAHRQRLLGAWGQSKYVTDIRPLHVRMRGNLLISDTKSDNISFNITDLIEVNPIVDGDEVRRKSTERFGSSSMGAVARQEPK